MSGMMTERNSVPSLTLSLLSSHHDLLSPKGQQIYSNGDLQNTMGLVSGDIGGGAPSDRTNLKWLKEGQNQLRKAAELVREDQNCNPNVESANKDWDNHNQDKELEISALNSANLSSMLGPSLLIQLPDEEEEDDDVTPAKSEFTDPITTETSELSSDLLDLRIHENGKETNEVSREAGRSASLLFGMRNNAGSDEDSSWATLSQESPSYGSPDDTDFWTRNSLDTDSDLPSGWMRVQDTSGTYYWHVPTGTTQWEPPSDICNISFKHYPLSQDQTPTEEEISQEEYSDISHNELEEANVLSSCSITIEEKEAVVTTETHRFAVLSLGVVEMTEEDLAPGRSSVAVNNCIRQLSLQNSNFSQAKDMLLVLDQDSLKLYDSSGQTLLHTQPIVSIRVWGVGRDDGRDFAYVARDKLTQVLKCHVFRCENPAKAIATGLHGVCSRIMAERRSTRLLMNGLCLDNTRMVDVPFQVEFPAPKNELVQRFQVFYLGSVPVSKPVGMELINNTLQAALSTCKADWVPVNVNVAAATVTIIHQQVLPPILFQYSASLFPCVAVTSTPILYLAILSTSFPAFLYSLGIILPSFPSPTANQVLTFP
ncbi:hypothetical protein GDO86_004785 [Hymenochirus boettgeri]|uniref:Amyloid beta (A4) precursor protein-binding, family B, member 1 (Fe65) n=1 Tax=Hymenochirus boettgeri TaxID=247094 RepID=A0A8T2K7B6_9PIPI|nr:hypothetical protein GDO86_004785 [Hymenochirus boettgeri]